MQKNADQIEVPSMSLLLFPLNNRATKFTQDRTLHLFTMIILT